MADVLRFPVGVVPPITVHVSPATAPMGMPRESLGLELHDASGCVVVVSWVHPACDKDRVFAAAWDFAEAVSADIISAIRQPGA